MLLKISLPNASAMTLVKTRLVSTKSNWSSKVAFLSPIWFTSTLSARKESTFSYEHILTVKISVPNWKVACKISWCLYQCGFDKSNSKCIWYDILSSTNWRELHVKLCWIKNEKLFTFSVLWLSRGLPDGWRILAMNNKYLT